MLILLSPSETKAAGGDGPPLDLADLSFPARTPTRETVLDALVALATVAGPRAEIGADARGSTRLDLIA